MLLDLSHRTHALPELFRREVHPTPLPAPSLVHFNDDAAALLGLDPALAEDDEFVAILAGSLLPEDGRPVATLYAGHQFGVWVPQLGDGRAILLGERRARDGRAWEIQLKGAGPTPFSRGGDGRSVLRSAIREYLCSEAMHGLGIPTTRALAIVGSDQPVFREEIETAAVLTRIAPSHVRFGTFEVLFYRGLHDDVRLLAEHVIAHHFPEIGERPDRFVELLREVVRRTARLMAQWQAVGFAHGVMNTDNMSILGLTLDYGPFGFLDAYEPGFVCNHSDDMGRYAFDRQPAIARWNLRCLAQALLPLMSRDEALDALALFDDAYVTAYAALMREKAGFSEARDEDATIVGGLLDLMAGSRADYTNTFRALGRFSTAEGARNDDLRDRILDRERFDAWAKTYRERLVSGGSDDRERRARMERVNPKYVLRNWIAEETIRAAADRDDSTVLDRVMKMLRRPFDEQPENERFSEEPPDWGRHLVVSCSS